jgi:hypothetical protein
MRQKIEAKIEDVQSRPEHKRHRTVLVLTLIGGIIIVLVWVFLLLPAQLQLAG